MKSSKSIIPNDLQEKFEFHNFGYALEILPQACPNEWAELVEALRAFSIPLPEIIAAGGNESAIPKRFDDLLYPHGWREIRITGDLLIKMYPRKSEQRRGTFSSVPFDQKTIEGYVDGHNIDFVKNKVAFDLEWNSKDQTFDRDLLAIGIKKECIEGEKK